MSAFLFKKRKLPKPLNQKIFNEVRKIISQQLKENEAKITPDSRIIDDLGTDSLDIVELILELEEAFSIEIPDEDAEKIFTVREIVEYIEDKLKEKNTKISG